MADSNYRCHLCDGKVNDFVQLNTTSKWCNIEIAFHHTGMLRVRVFDSDGSIVNQDVVTLPTCVNCGRKLTCL